MTDNDHNEQAPGTQTDWPTVSILILNWNGRALLEMCLPPLVKQTYSNEYEVILVDNASEDDSISFTQSTYPQVHIIRHQENLGFSRGMNAALRQLNSDIVVLLNNDVVAQPNWLLSLIHPMVKDPSIGIAGCKLLFPDQKTIQHAGAELSYPSAYSNHLFFREYDQGQIHGVQDVAYVTGAAVAVHRQVWDKVGLFDEQFSPFYYEEVDLCYRAREAGFRVVVVADAVAIHHQSASIKQVSQLHQHTFHKNRLRFVLKHYSIDQFLEAFVPAEIERLKEPTSAHQYHAIAQACLETAVAAPTSMTADGDRAHITNVQTALLQIRQTALRQQPTRHHLQGSNWPGNELKQHYIIREPEFVSRVPVIGFFIAGFRYLWSYLIITKWYVHSLVHQQTMFNRLASRLLNEHESRSKSNADSITLLLAELLKLQDDNRRLQQRLDQMENRTLEHHQE